MSIVRQWEAKTTKNTFFRKVLLNSPSEQSQLIGMKLDPSEEIDLEVHRFDQWFFIVDGSVNVYTGKESKRTLVKAGNIFLVPARTLHKVKNHSAKANCHLATIYTGIEHSTNAKTKTQAEQEEESKIPKRSNRKRKAQLD